MKIMAIDYGEIRVGIALTDPLGVIAQPYMTLKAKPQKALIDRLKFIIAENSVGLILVGNPISNRGLPTPMSETVLNFVERLKKSIAIEVKLWDERYTSQYAAVKLREFGIKKQTQKLDQVAAAIILEEYLNSCSRTA